MKKVIILIVIVIFLVILASCFFISKNTKNEKSVDVVENVEVINALENNFSSGDNQVNKEKPILYFFNGEWLAISKNNKLIWDTEEKIKLSNIFDNEFYSVYYVENKREKVNNIVFPYDLYMGYGLELSGEAYSESLKGFWYYDENSGDNGFLMKYFHIPNRLNKELNERYLLNSHLGANKLLAEFPLKEEDRIEFFDDNVKHSLLAYNSNHDVKFAKRIDNYTYTEDLKSYLKKFFKATALSESIEYYVKDYFKQDLNGDGEEDELFCICSNDTLRLVEEYDQEKYDEYEKMAEKYGTFSLLLTKINGEYKILDYSLFPAPAITGEANYYNNIIVVDINNDDIYEIFVEEHGWEYVGSFVAYYENERYIIALPEEYKLKQIEAISQLEEKINNLNNNND